MLNVLNETNLELKMSIEMKKSTKEQKKSGSVTVILNQVTKG